MTAPKLIVIAILIALFPTLSVRAQVVASGTTRFEKNGLAFDHPADWKISEGRAEDSEFAELAPENKTVQLLIQWQFGAFLDCEFEGMRKRLARELVDRVAAQIHNAAPPETAWQKAQLGKVGANQIQLRGLLNNNLVIADIYSLTVKHYLLNIVYLRVANDETGSSAWKTFETTMKLGEPGKPAAGNPSSGGILNGRAISLPRPDYPAIARARRAAGTVVVQVLIDELGNVFAVCAISGHSSLRQVCEEAARSAKFTPTKLSGKPVRVTGVIVYNFVAQ